MQYFVKSFENLTSFADFCKTAPVNSVFKNSVLESEHGRPSWTGTASLADADFLLQYGDRKNAERITNTAAGGLKSNSADDIRARRVRSVTGSSVNVAAALAGRPKAMYKIERKIVNTKVLNFAFNCAADCTIEAEQLAVTAARLTSAILGIEKKAYRVNWYVCMIAKTSKETSAAFVKIKDSKTYIDKTKMAYPLINPSFLRRHSFAFIERNPGLRGSFWTFGYGYPVKSADEQRTAAEEAHLNLQKIVNYYELKDKDEAGIIDYLMK